MCVFPPENAVTALFIRDAIVMVSKLEQNLQILDFEINTDEPSLLFTNRVYSKTEISFGSRLVLEDAKKLSATAVFFRHDRASAASQPQIFIYDNTNQSLSDRQLAEIHRKIWSSDIVSIYYVIDRTQVRVFDARKPVRYKGEHMSVDAFETLDLVTEAQEQYQKYSAKLFENGTFWEQPEHHDKFLHNNSSSKKLLNELKGFRDRFVAENSANHDLIHKLLVQSILVKYLEERRDEDGKSVFVEGFFSQFANAKDYCDVIRNGQFVELLNALSIHFNGKIFELTPSEIKIINDLDLSMLSNFLDAKLDDNQYSFWRLYAFDYVPVELISRIYEEFIPQRADAVYTPIHLAQFMVDECMPLEFPQQDYKLIDVSCGSGIFLVTAFKRLVQWWQKRQYEQTGELVRATVDVLQLILRDSIHGVDIEQDAVRLTVFSLSIALCDMLSPTEIWLNLKFDNLEQKNLFADDYFRFLHSAKAKDFDLVIGNPPFKGSSGEVTRILEDFDLDIEYAIPRDQVALLFLQQSMQLLRTSGLLCLVMPSGPLLYNKSIDYREHFFSRYEVPQIVDFSALFRKGHLFESEVATSVIFAKNQAPKHEHEILHIAVKRTKVAREKRFFEIDLYDLHYVPLAIAVTDSIVWKTNLLGGGQLYYLVDRLSKERSLGDYLEQKRTESKNESKPNKWAFGEGYIIGGNNEFDAPHITGKPLLETDQFQESGILNISTETTKKFTAPRKHDYALIFEPPHLLIKESPGVNQFVTAYTEDYLVFKNEIIGIHAPWEDAGELKRIESYLQENYLLLKTLLLSFSGRAGISHSFSTVLKKDFMALPYPKDVSVLELSLNEEVIVRDILDYGLEELKRGERAFVNINNVDTQHLIEFGDRFSQNLNSIYRSENNVFRPLEPIHQVSYICFPFIYGDDEKLSVVSSEAMRDLDNLLRNERRSVAFQRVLYMYQQDIVYLIKPKTLRYWLKSIALRDATQVMQDLVASGY